MILTVIDQALTSISYSQRVLYMLEHGIYVVHV